MLLSLLSSISTAALAQNAATAPASPALHPPAFQIAADGKFVIDTRAKLAWPRCAEGMDWNGKTCSGSAEVFNYKQAQTYAAERSKAENQRWRLPRVNELKRLLDRSSKPQGLNPELFPAAPRDWHWTSTASVNSARINQYNYSQVDKSNTLSSLSAQQAWAVNTETLEATPDMGKGNALLLRLVRPATELELKPVP
ncbi:DUF1566 domain-containing protein [Comamonas sp. Y33R10-2]|uniref:Lcl C-terminal domain-containing protein n=1 Tax=Comamonas sp. Y33R10-2 TaxID=2853257 RepID=UPI001C5CC0BA|nr:DUF1566 domain-containing protein [Comamonas sp. Y33R10-2]QXZ11026.1 DUF1566 domain-containing protein [Comamonas sp. Y33R10-2]